MKIIKSFYTLYSALIFAVLMLLFGIFIVFPLILSSKGAKVSFVFIRLWAGTWAFLSGIRYEIHGKEFLDPKQPYIYIFNHRSFIDAPLIPLAISQEIRAIGKKELSQIPLFGTVVGRFAVWVDRANPESRKESLVKLLAILKTGQSIVVAPEGTRNDTKERLLPFQKGAFRLSIETQIPIMPIAFIGAENIMKRGSLLLSPGKVRIYFSAPISPPQQSEHAIEEFSEKCKNRLDAMILAHE
jgi:1-acyl-sn-glycerol-3-phosphate acyltransferase